MKELYDVRSQCVMLVTWLQKLPSNEHNTFKNTCNIYVHFFSMFSWQEVYFWLAHMSKIEMVILPKAIEPQISLHLQVSCNIISKSFAHSLWNRGIQIKLNEIDLLCTSRNGTNWTISRDATRPVVLSSRSPLSASKI